MKNLTRIFFCTFVAYLYSCEPEPISENISKEPKFLRTNDEIGETGNQKKEIDDDME